MTTSLLATLALVALTSPATEARVAPPFTGRGPTGGARLPSLRAPVNVR